MAVRARKASLATGAAGIVVFLWILATALPDAGETAGASASGLESGLRPPRHSVLLASFPETGPVIESARPPHSVTSSSSLDSEPEPSDSATSRESLTSFASGLAPPPATVTSLSPSALEKDSDGLPASAMHCGFEGGLMRCGKCRTDSDCPAGQGCVINREARRFECMDSECEEDIHCFPGFVCRAVTTGAGGPVIRRCTPEGLRREGEPCSSGYVSRESACREGLRCIHMRCAAPCRLEDPASCPSGYTCTDHDDGPGCVPDCRQLGCPGEQRCIHVRDSRYQCLERVVGTCHETPCAEGERCVTWMSRNRGAFWCARDCTPLLPESCPADHVCGRASPTTSACFRQCDPRERDACGEGWHCTTVSEDLTLWGCSPDYEG